MPLLLPNFSFTSISYVQFTSTLSVKCTFSSIPNKALSQGMAVVQGALQGRAGAALTGGWASPIEWLPPPRRTPCPASWTQCGPAKMENSTAYRKTSGEKDVSTACWQWEPLNITQILMYPLAVLCKNRNKCFSSPDPCVFARKGGGDWRATALFWLGSI